MGAEDIILRVKSVKVKRSPGRKIVCFRTSTNDSVIILNCGQFLIFGHTTNYNTSEACQPADVNILVTDATLRLSPLTVSHELDQYSISSCKTMTKFYFGVNLIN